MGKRKEKDSGFAWAEDENKERGNWTGKADFLLSTIGYAVGLGNVWRFPYKAYDNGGASFLLPYIIFLLTCGIPMFFMELSLGQFTSSGPISVWNSMPLFKGLGWGMAMISFLVCIYYNMIIAYTLYYLFASFTSRLPWVDCRDEWMRLNISGKLSTCIERNDDYKMIQAQTAEFCNMSLSMSNNDTDDYLYNTSMSNNYRDDYLYNTSMGNIYTDDYLYNCTATKKTPALLYWERVVLDISEGMDDGQTEMKWQLVLCLLFSWIIVFLCMFKGVKSSGRVVYFTAVFPYVVLIVLCIRNALLPGSIRGVEFYLTPNIEKLSDPKPWYDASIQIFYSLGIAFGGLGTMASYNRFKNNTYRDTLLVACINCGTSVFAGFVIFSVIGYMAEITGENIENVVDSGPGLAFVAYPEGLATMPVAPLWSILFFLMLITLGLDTQFTMLETVITALTDEFQLNKRFKYGKLVLTASLCVFMFLIGLPQCSRAGVYVMNLFDWYCAGYSIIIIAFFEVIAVAWIYDFRRFKKDIQMMVGNGCFINASFYYYWFPMWIIISPAMMMYILVNMSMGFGPIKYSGVIPYPAYADGIGFLMVALALVFLPVVALIEYCKAHGFISTMTKVLRPIPSWGPALDEHRTGRYAPLGHELTEVNGKRDFTDIAHVSGNQGFVNDVYVEEKSAYNDRL